MREVDFLEIVEYFSYRVKKSGEEYKTFCPTCSVVSARIQFYERHRYVCLGCHQNGDALQYIINHGHNFVQACRILCEIKKIPLSDIEV